MGENPKLQNMKCGILLYLPSDSVSLLSALINYSLHIPAISEAGMMYLIVLVIFHWFKFSILHLSFGFLTYVVFGGEVVILVLNSRPI
jgi:hypothetical protein